MREDMGLPTMVATMPKWSIFSRPWLSGHTCVSMDSRCVSPEHTPKSASGAAASGSRRGARYLRVQGQGLAGRSAELLVCAGPANSRLDTPVFSFQPASFEDVGTVLSASSCPQTGRFVWKRRWWAMTTKRGGDQGVGGPNVVSVLTQA